MFPEKGCNSGTVPRMSSSSVILGCVLPSLDAKTDLLTMPDQRIEMAASLTALATDHLRSFRFDDALAAAFETHVSKDVVDQPVVFEQDT